ncbi:MAG: UDP-N-acetylmuramoyl-L-alanyl-D-glutamate--2,6-diaminopimelate ligase [Alphaproteobacteria bacterium]|nr:UDP-N-acetylmuramoyl-L-alanyl-D-glutamate--2,6-diaminopimelate ligase [Alphaproteobacteria bacterium]
MKLSTLIGAPCNPDPEISGLTADSRDVRPGTLFAALAGVAADGAAFIDEAIEAGATAVLTSAATAAGRADLSARGIAVVGVDDPRRALAFAAARLFAGRPAKVVGVTGTNGKTSTAWFAAGVWRVLGRRAGVIGTLGAIGDGYERELRHTTPDPIVVHSVLSEMAAAGVERVAMEASSHGLAQRRVDAVRFDGGAFTNITQDHLDYHADFADYFSAKRRLFEDCLVDGASAVISMDGRGARDMRDAAASLGRNVVEAGFAGRDLRLTDVRADVDGLVATVAVDGASISFSLPCIGAFQAENALTAAGLVGASEGGRAFSEAIAALDGLAGPPGRMQRAATVNGAGVYVDYAHTPDALRVVLAAARPHATGRLVAVIGAGGDRDRGKRPLMGAAAQALADLVIVTDDNPRTEDPAAIRQAVLAGAPGAIEIGDRRDAIRRAVRELRAGDLLVVAGKGHERGQVIGDRVYPFDDVEAVIDAAGAAA